MPAGSIAVIEADPLASVTSVEPPAVWPISVDAPLADDAAVPVHGDAGEIDGPLTGGLDVHVAVHGRGGAHHNFGRRPIITADIDIAANSRQRAKVDARRRRVAVDTDRAADRRQRAKVDTCRRRVAVDTDRSANRRQRAKVDSLSPPCCR